MIVWVNIAIQLFLPLSLSLTPTIAAAQRAHDSVFSNPTELYTLGVNEPIDTVAKKLELTVDDLKKINRYRLFSKPFEQLTTGDEIDIPRTAPLLSIDNNRNNHIAPAAYT
ncbi:hypothetical protein CS369_05875 [Candidatus Symbiopectobacterium sp. 'North America']|nr:hypothetical protein [Candidatus Symbiopectobacterium sp. 'North America']